MKGEPDKISLGHGRTLTGERMTPPPPHAAGPSRFFRPSSFARPPSQSQRALPASLLPPPASQTVASLLQTSSTVGTGPHSSQAPTTPPTWSTGCKAIDELLSGTAHPTPSRRTPDHRAPQTPDRILAGFSSSSGHRALCDARLRVNQMDPPSSPSPQMEKGKTKVGVCPGMVLEVASPPGGGKTSLVKGLVVRARLEGGGVEVLVIGECGRAVDARW